MPWTAPATWTSTQVVDEDDLNEQVRDNIKWLYDNLPQRATLWHRHSTVLSGDAIVSTVDAGMVFNHYAAQGGPGNGDSFAQSVMLAAGEYRLKIICQTTTASGKLDLDLDGVSIVAGEDFYSNPAVSNVVKLLAGIVVSTGGRHVLTGTVNGKNAASSSYGIRINQMFFYLTAGDSVAT